MSKILDPEFFDLACHANKGKTKRTEPMFGPAGHFYVYMIYGMYWMLNIATGPKDYPAAILIRGTREISGPGRLTNHLQIDKSINSKRSLRSSTILLPTKPDKPVPITLGFLFIATIQFSLNLL